MSSTKPVRPHAAACKPKQVKKSSSSSSSSSDSESGEGSSDSSWDENQEKERDDALTRDIAGLEKRLSELKAQQQDRKQQRTEREARKTGGAIVNLNEGKQNGKGQLVLSSDAGTITHNAIEYMKQGSAMLKYGRRGFPHFRHFEVSAKCDLLIWYSENKRLSQTQIRLVDVDEIRVGQSTTVFQRHPQPRLAQCSFSLIYGHGSRTLDLICRTKADFTIWTQGLRKLIANLRSGYPKAIPSIPITVAKSKGPNRRKLNLRPVPSRPKIEMKFNELKNRFMKNCRMKVHHPKLIMQQAELNKKVRSIEQQINKVTETLAIGELALASHEIWKLEIEVNVMSTRIGVLQAPKGGLGAFGKFQL